MPDRRQAQCMPRSQGVPIVGYFESTLARRPEQSQDDVTIEPTVKWPLTPTPPSEYPRQTVIIVFPELSICRGRTPIDGYPASFATPQVEVSHARPPVVAARPSRR